MEKKTFAVELISALAARNLFPAGGHEKISLRTQHITPIRIGNEVDFTPPALFLPGGEERGGGGYRRARGITRTPRI